ncbi:MAG: hypothetical protein ACOYW9_05335 [Deinococcota bacterium]|nr:hypothetical protein [Allomeiothermus silvanus]
MISIEQGVGATAEEKVREIAPLVEYFQQELGLGAGRLMLATSFLRDARQMQPEMNPQARAALEQAEALVVSVMIRFLDRGLEGCSCEEDAKTQAQAWVDRARSRS